MATPGGQEKHWWSRVNDYAVPRLYLIALRMAEQGLIKEKVKHFRTVRYYQHLGSGQPYVPTPKPEAVVFLEPGADLFSAEATGVAAPVPKLKQRRRQKKRAVMVTAAASEFPVVAQGPPEVAAVADVAVECGSSAGASSSSPRSRSLSPCA